IGRCHAELPVDLVPRRAVRARAARAPPSAGVRDVAGGGRPGRRGGAADRAVAAASAAGGRAGGRMSEPANRDAWQALADLTPARVALGRVGVSLPTREVLSLALDHARARDAVQRPLDAAAVAAAVRALGVATVAVHSAAPDR